MDPSFIFDPELPFDTKRERLFRFQSERNPVYRRFCDSLGFRADKPPEPGMEPLLPIRGFRDTALITEGESADLLFHSSGTAGMRKSEHHVADAEIYRRSVLEGFEQHYSADSVLWAWLPGYRDNPFSSLIHMAEILINRDNSGLSHIFPPGDLPDKDDLEKLDRSGRSLVLFGAAFGLIDLLEESTDPDQPFGVPLPADTTIIETGGMKTHRREMSRMELHSRLSEGFGVAPGQIHSEYGMCELLSQAYACGNPWFQPVPWMEVTIRDPEDSFRICTPGEEGKIGIVDLANIYSCPFILTEDRGVADGEGRFQVLGRWRPDNLRGCNFLIDRD
ncbi:MAG: hypothetical protein WD355_01425 [Balneolaceae bacterium]